MKKISFLWIWVYFLMVFGQDNELNSVNTAEFWIAKQKNPSQIMMGKEEIMVNFRKNSLDSFFQNKQLGPKELLLKIDTLISYTKNNVYFENKKQISKSVLNKWKVLLNKNEIEDSVKARYGLVVERTLARNYPFYQIILKQDFNKELDRSIESALYLGEPIKIWHQNADSTWFFVETVQFFGWIERDKFGFLPEKDWLDFQKDSDFLMIHSDKVSTKYHPQTRSFNKTLEIGMKFPLYKAVENFNAKTLEKYYIIEVPTLDSNQNILFLPHLVEKNEKVSTDFLPFNAQNLIEKAFVFLGERYGWGGMNGTRDCSSYINDVYKNFGFILKRNSKQMFEDERFLQILTPEKNLNFQKNYFKDLPVGSIFYMSGHVMLYLGEHEGEYFIIHDLLGGSVQKEGNFTYLPLLGVHVTGINNFFTKEKQSFWNKIKGFVAIDKKLVNLFPSQIEVLENPNFE